MLGYLILLFIFIPLAELALLLKLGQYIGLGYTLIVVILTGILGAYLARQEGFRVLRIIEREVNQGILPADKVFDGLIILCSGLLLLTPGFITDTIGLVGLLPFTRGLIKQLIKRKLKEAIGQGKVISITSFRSFRSPPNF